MSEYMPKVGETCRGQWFVSQDGRSMNMETITVMGYFGGRVWVYHDGLVFDVLESCILFEPIKTKQDIEREEAIAEMCRVTKE